MVTVVVCVAETSWLAWRPSEQSSVYEVPPPVIPAVAETGARQTKAATAQDASFKSLDTWIPRTARRGQMAARKVLQIFWFLADANPQKNDNR